MAPYLIVIAVDGKPKAVDRLIDKLDNVTMEVTMDGGIDGLTTEIVRGTAAIQARDRLREPAKKPTK